jgi:hypothetical protein
MVIGTKNDDATLILLTLDSSEDQMNIEVSLQTLYIYIFQTIYFDMF